MAGESDTPIVTIDGSLITLGPLSKDLVPLMTRWMNDLGLQIRLGMPLYGPMTIEAEEQWYEGEVSPDNRRTFLIRERASGTPIGACSLFGIDYRERFATFAIVIGESSARGKGFGTEAARLMLDYGFTVLSLHSIRLGVAAYNLAGQRAYANAGFKACGRYRESISAYGQMWDEILMDCLVHEFDGSTLKDRFGPDQPR